MTRIKRHLAKQYPLPLDDPQGSTINHQAWGQFLRSWRGLTGLSQPQAAARLGVPYKSWEKWEQGTRTPRGRNRRMLVLKFWVAGKEGQ